MYASVGRADILVNNAAASSSRSLEATPKMEKVHGNQRFRLAYLMRFVAEGDEAVSGEALVNLASHVQLIAPARLPYLQCQQRRSAPVDSLRSLGSCVLTISASNCVCRGHLTGRCRRWRRKKVLPGSKAASNGAMQTLHASANARSRLRVLFWPPRRVPFYRQAPLFVDGGYTPVNISPIVGGNAPRTLCVSPVRLTGQSGEPTDLMQVASEIGILPV